jgi:hypothetical protein
MLFFSNRVIVMIINMSLLRTVCVLVLCVIWNKITRMTQRHINITVLASIGMPVMRVKKLSYQSLTSRPTG